MGIIRKLKIIYDDPLIISDKLASKFGISMISDEKYLKRKFKTKIGEELNLENPQTFNEKLQYLKLYDRNPLYMHLVDKYKVREYVAEIIGEEYIVPLYGVWDDFEEIDFSKLPNTFVLKTNHDSSGAIICEDKEKFDIERARKKINYSLNRNYFYAGREWPYKNVKPRIICEKYLEDTSDLGLKDYKFHCFSGKPVAMFVATDEKGSRRMDFYDMNFTPLDMNHGHKNNSHMIEKPEKFDKMINLARQLSKNFPYVRVDFYELEGKIYFGELTFYPASGFREFTPSEVNIEYGNLIDLSKAYTHQKNIGDRI